MSELNLIPYELKGRKGKSLDQKTIIISLIVAIIVLGGAIAYPLITYRMLQSEEKSLKNEIQMNQAVLKESNQLAQAIQGYKQYIAMVDDITKLSPKVVNRVRGLEKFMPADVKINSLSLASSGITVGATSGSINSIADFTANIQESADYKGARISGYTPNKEKANYTFTITINY